MRAPLKPLSGPKKNARHSQNTALAIAHQPRMEIDMRSFTHRRLAKIKNCTKAGQLGSGPPPLASADPQGIRATPSGAVIFSTKPKSADDLP
jgi:hypothetical protein